MADTTRYRGLYILIGLVVILLIAVFVYTKNEKAGKKEVITTTDIRGIRIERTTDTTELTLTDGKWMLSKPMNYPADSALLARLIIDLNSLKIGEVISEREEKFKDFGVGDDGIKVTVLYSKKELSFFIGRYASDYNHSYFRFAGDTKIYLSEGLSRYTVDKKPDDFRDKRILLFNKENLREIVIDGKRITRSDTIWVLDDRKVDTKKISSVVNMLSSLYADGFADTLSFQPEWKILLVFDGERCELEVGEKQERHYAVRKSGSPGIFLIREKRIKRILGLVE